MLRAPVVLRSAAAATVFLTRIPLPPSWYNGPHPWRLALRWFPVIGAAIGLLLSQIWMLLAGMDRLPAAFVVIIAGALVTGALHEDGLADSADALGGATSRERAFEILKDSRIGTYGALALTCSVGIRVSSLASISDGAGTALLLAHSISRAVAVHVMATTAYVTPARSARSSVFSRASWPDALWSWSIIALILGVATALARIRPRFAAEVAAVSMAIAFAAAFYFKRRLGGHTGDTLGAAQQTAESMVLLMWAAAG